MTSLYQQAIPTVEVPISDSLNEQAVLGFDTTAIQSQLGVTISSVSWSVEDNDVLSLGSGGSSGDNYFVPVTALIVGCSHLIAEVTTSDSNHNPTLLFMKISVIKPACVGI